MKPRKYTKLYEWQLRASSNGSYCEKCGRIYYLSVDHIIPQTILLSLNLENEIYEWEDNFQILCGACQKVKGGDLDLSNPKTLSLLKAAIKKTENQNN